MEYKKVSVITKELNIYKSLIYKLINQILKNELKDHTKKINNVLYLDADGIKIIKNHLKITNEKVINKESDNSTIDKKLDDILDTLKEILNVLQKPNIENEVTKKTNIENKSTPKNKNKNKNKQEIQPKNEVIKKDNVENKFDEKTDDIKIDFEIKEEYSSPEIAVILNLSKKYISEMIRKGRLKGTKKGKGYYISHNDLMDYINKNTK